MTVSLALRNDLRLPFSTRKRIHAVAEKLGYRPHPLARMFMRNLRSGHHQSFVPTLAYVTAFPTRHGWKSHHAFQAFFEAARDRADRLGYKLEEFWLREPHMTGAKLSRILHTRSIPGVIVAPLPTAMGHIQLEWSRFAAAAIGYTLRQPLVPRVAPNHYETMLLGLRTLKRHGYERIGLILRRDTDSRINHLWRAAMLVFQHRLKSSCRVPILLGETWNSKQFLKWNTRFHPDVVIATRCVVRNWLEDAGYRVGREIGYLHLEWSEEGKNSATLDLNLHAVGAAAVNLVVQQLEQNERGIPATAPLVLAQGRWVDGPTLRRKMG